MSYRDTYDFWMTDDYFDDDTKKELAAIAGDDAEIEDRFYRDLVFGTGGLRGVIGAGTNRMNFYTVRKATQGLANFIVKQNAQEKGVTGAEKIRKIMSSLRVESLTQIDTLKVIKVRDYEKNTITDLATGEVTESGLPQSNVLYYDLEDADVKLESLQAALVEKLNKLAE